MNYLDDLRIFFENDIFGKFKKFIEIGDCYEQNIPIDENYNFVFLKSKFDNFYVIANESTNMTIVSYDDKTLKFINRIMYDKHIESPYIEITKRTKKIFIDDSENNKEFLFDTFTEEDIFLLSTEMNFKCNAIFYYFNELYSNLHSLNKNTDIETIILSWK